MYIGRVLALSLAALLLTAQGATAQDDDLGELTTRKPVKKQQTAAEELADQSRTGVYIGVGGTFAIENFGDLTSGGDFENGWGFNFRLGRRMHKFAALELEVEKFAGFDGNAAEVDGWMIGLNGRGYFLPGRFQPYVLLGAGYADYEFTDNTLPNPPHETHDGFGMRFGGGIDVYATQTVVVTTDIAYILGVGDINEFDVIALSFGIAYRP
ncbi:MAG TPA: outer membrane beta-barrel protein [Candidatus Limnocylindrales bacterium]|nr:outer membrane beta-barrel protein [Candidatus Limnocylindrales bacterium]